MAVKFNQVRGREISVLKIFFLHYDRCGGGGRVVRRGRGRGRGRSS